MQSIASHIESLSSNGLAESARLLSGFYLSASAKQPCKASPGRLRALASFADGLFETREYVRAVVSCASGVWVGGGEVAGCLGGWGLTGTGWGWLWVLTGLLAG
eukprot:m.220736 g.220736  ORF g.220736 m.220736 type:complete len:104 (-) comp22278_c0_seq1:66-377(-)